MSKDLGRCVNDSCREIIHEILKECLGSAVSVVFHIARIKSKEMNL